eukprot:6248033-Amphidinium_carterae.1
MSLILLPVIAYVDKIWLYASRLVPRECRRSGSLIQALCTKLWRLHHTASHVRDTLHVLAAHARVVERLLEATPDHNVGIVEEELCVGASNQASACK